ncbi:hypothetical protein PUNSTDRAFT_41496 [Punctularia strigosozonata HHB-11173 SS5]|uniref:uncharacterized protein n=1 Tax=Punctularia strigosozonata (strain HHB-11173) TaxID=741275 RepID=UPI0004416A37|nr:uncharacterized protein PUNSTDRAFT_41496 [Punctularia strigosozonata HHB-11173 SS5]EIN14224.1 hypothetical protein PUNSTDRAFT_41496 [Punctularia strigosozonata HHB-11173 SS5]
MTVKRHTGLISAAKGRSGRRLGQFTARNVARNTSVRSPPQYEYTARSQSGRTLNFAGDVETAQRSDNIMPNDTDLTDYIEGIVHQFTRERTAHLGSRQRSKGFAMSPRKHRRGAASADFPTFVTGIESEQSLRGGQNLLRRSHCNAIHEAINEEAVFQGTDVIAMRADEGHSCGI